METVILRKPGVATSIREINGTTADNFRHGHPTDERFCMYAAINALNHELWVISQNHPSVIVACENPVRTWSAIGMPSRMALVSWDVLTDPVIAWAYYGKENGGETMPGPLFSEAFCRSHGAFVRVDLPLSENPPEVRTSWCRRGTAREEHRDTSGNDA